VAQLRSADLDNAGIIRQVLGLIQQLMQHVAAESGLEWPPRREPTLTLIV
jgi:hypothetical protein